MGFVAIKGLSDIWAPKWKEIETNHDQNNVLNKLGEGGSVILWFANVISTIGLRIQKPPWLFALTG